MPTAGMPVPPPLSSALASAIHPVARTRVRCTAYRAVSGTRVWVSQQTCADGWGIQFFAHTNDNSKITTYAGTFATRCARFHCTHKLLPLTLLHLPRIDTYTGTTWALLTPF